MCVCARARVCVKLWGFKTYVAKNHEVNQKKCFQFHIIIDYRIYIIER